jgi:hypothetical protein
LQVHQHHAGFGVFVAGAVDVFQDGAGRLGCLRLCLHLRYGSDHVAT